MKRPVAGKTGTTNNYTDAWFIGFTPSLAMGVWVGFDEKVTLGDKETGGRVALPIWFDAMQRIYKDRKVEPSSHRPVHASSHGRITGQRRGRRICGKGSSTMNRVLSGRPIRYLLECALQAQTIADIARQERAKRNNAQRQPLLPSTMPSRKAKPGAVVGAPTGDHACAQRDGGA
jgi:membrane carboxypeptidase/penicillin-binding protein